jgi:hypothetical protein
MSIRDEPVSQISPTISARQRHASVRRGKRLTGGGPDGNEVLTTTTGVVLVLLLAALGVTIVFIGQLLAEHLFLGFLLLGPVVLKLGSTGYRFARYYAGDPAYVEKGPPWMPLRMSAPVVVLTTLGVFITGILLVVVGPQHTGPWLLLHKASFIVWIVFMALHVAGHLPEISRLLGVRAEIFQLPGIRTDLDRVRYAERHPNEDTPPTAAAEARVARGPGSRGRLILLGASLIVGVIIAVALIPDYHTWLTLQPLLHHRDH